MPGAASTSYDVEPLLEQDRERGFCFGLFVIRHTPISGGIPQDKKNELHRGLIGCEPKVRASEMTLDFHGASQRWLLPAPQSVRP